MTQEVPLAITAALNEANGSNEWQGDAAPRDLVEPAVRAIKAIKRGALITRKPLRAPLQLMGDRTDGIHPAFIPGGYKRQMPVDPKHKMTTPATEFDPPLSVLLAAYAYVDTMVPEADYMDGSAPMWHGWAVREAWLTGYAVGYSAGASNEAAKGNLE